MTAVRLGVVRGRVTAQLEYYRVGPPPAATVRRARRSGALACLTHRSERCDHIEAVMQYLLRGRVVRFERRPA